MTYSHGSQTVVTVGGVDLSTFTNTSEIERGADKHDITNYGADDHSFSGGLKTGSFKMGGTYDTSAVGPRATLTAMIGTVVAIIRRPEGTGAGLPQDSFSALVEKYVETNPVADNVKWSCDFTVSGAVDDTAQTA